MSDWKKICREEYKIHPERLAPEVLECAQALYPALAQAAAMAFDGRGPYPNAPGLAALCRRLLEFS